MEKLKKSFVDGSFDKVDNPIFNAPHTVEEISSDEWKHIYTRQEAEDPSLLPFNQEILSDGANKSFVHWSIWKKRLIYSVFVLLLKNMKKLN